ncbi:MAG: FixH family protein [Nannocystaceae bacterium]|nr:FixH family protein [Nannocystaceae bacterium]
MTASTQERRARRFWISFILMFFAGQGVLWTFALDKVIGDPSHAVVEEYDDYENRWEASQAERSLNAALGWQAQLSADHEHLVVKLTDARGRPVDAEVTARVFHKARASEKHEAVFTRTEPGLLVSELDLERSGRWRVRLTATRGNETFTDIQDISVGQVAQR